MTQPVEPARPAWAPEATRRAAASPAQGLPGEPVPGTQEDLEVSVGDRVFFAYDSAVLSTVATQTLDRQAAWLKQYPDVVLTVEGHTDERGTREYNLALGDRRANAVKNYLVALDIEPGPDSDDLLWRGAAGRGGQRRDRLGQQPSRGECGQHGELMVRGVAKSSRQAGAGISLGRARACWRCSRRRRRPAPTLRPWRSDLAGLRAELAELRGIQLVQATPGERAQFEVRLGQLEEELRRLTGRIEQLEFGQRTVESRIDQLIQDLDVRLAPSSRAPRRPVRASTGPDAAAGAGSAAARIRPSAGPGADAGFGRQDSASEGTLGVVPESALLDLPRPDPAAATPPANTSLPAQRQYDSAMELLRAGDYPSAERGLELFLDLNPDHPLASNAAYWMAETLYVRKNYAAAASGFARNYRTYGKDAPKAPDNLLKLGMSLFGLGDAEKACLSYAELAQEFPNAPTHIEQALDRESTRAGCS